MTFFYKKGFPFIWAAVMAVVTIASVAHEMLPETLERYFPILFGFSLVWVSGWILASILCRRSRGKEIYGLEHDVPVDQVTRVEVTSGRSGRVRLEFRDPRDTLQDITVYLRNPDEFVRALGKDAR